MKKRNGTIVALVVILVLLWVICVGMLVLESTDFLGKNLFVGGMVIPRNAEYLNLRNREISVQTYQRIHEELPSCEIYWNVPFQDTHYPENTTEITVQTLSDGDVIRLDYLKQLQTVDAQGCTDYAQIKLLQKRRPGVKVQYTVVIDGKSYTEETRSIYVERLTETEIGWLQYLPNLTTIDAKDCTDYLTLAKLQEIHPEYTVQYVVPLAGVKYQSTTTGLICENPELSELAEALKYLPKVETVHIQKLSGDTSQLLALTETYPEITFSWELELFGQTVSSADSEIELTGLDCSIEELEAALAGLPNLDRVVLTDCAIANDQLAVLRAKMRPEYKVVWTVMCGEIPVRTDETFFHPVQQHVYYFYDEDCENLVYCEDMICVDVGHMSVTHCDWVTGMPNLKYLILGCCGQLKDIGALQECKKLVFLELELTSVRDLTPLRGCTALEDINLGYSGAQVDVLTQMPWLKNIWWSGCTADGRRQLTEALPDTNMQFSAENSTSKGWRRLPNYYDMRDVLGMPYMD